MRTLGVLAVLFLVGCAVVSPPDSPPDTIAGKRPLSAIAVTQCGLAVALYIQLDPVRLLRADPRQSELFTSVDGQQRETHAGPLPWAEAYKLAQSAQLTSHVALPCTDGPAI